MGDSFTVERHACVAEGCDGYVLFFVDAESVKRPRERSRAICDHCGRINILQLDGSRVLQPTASS